MLKKVRKKVLTKANGCDIITKLSARAGGKRSVIENWTTRDWRSTKQKSIVRNNLGNSERNTTQTKVRRS